MLIKIKEDEIKEEIWGEEGLSSGPRGDYCVQEKQIGERKDVNLEAAFLHTSQEAVRYLVAVGRMS